MEYSPAGDLADSPRTGEAGPRPAAGVGEHSPLVCGAITCSAPVYVLVFTCGRPGSRNLRSCPTRPAPVGGRRAALFSHLRQVRDSRAPCPLGVPVGPWRCSRDCKGNPQGASFPECTCVRVSQVRGSVCARVWTSRRVSVSIPCSGSSPVPPTPSPEWDPLLTLTPGFPKPGKFAREPGCAGGWSSDTSTAPPLTPRHLRRCSSSRPAPAPARAPPRRRSAGSQPAPDSGRPPGRAW